jgi:hypothetical protein
MLIIGCSNFGCLTYDYDLKSSEVKVVLTKENVAYLFCFCVGQHANCFGYYIVNPPAFSAIVN